MWECTHKEFREAIEGNTLKAMIAPTGSTEQHNEHLAMINDTTSVTLTAQQAVTHTFDSRFARTFFRGSLAAQLRKTWTDAIHRPRSTAPVTTFFGEQVRRLKGFMSSFARGHAGATRGASLIRVPRSVAS